MVEMERQVSTTAGRRAGKRAYLALAIFMAIIVGLYFAQPEDFQRWITALHVVAVISWMAGMLYMPRLFVYHSDAEPGSDKSETFKVMEQRLLKVIMNPAMMITWLLGLYLAWDVFRFQGGWLHAKITLVVLLTAVHVLFSRAVRSFAADGPRKSARFWRMMNEAPTLLMIAIVILVIVKPF
jgi:putative membrane protein